MSSAPDAESGNNVEAEKRYGSGTRVTEVSNRYEGRDLDEES